MGVCVCVNQKPYEGKAVKKFGWKERYVIQLCVPSCKYPLGASGGKPINPCASFKEKILLLNPPGSSCGVSRKPLTIPKITISHTHTALYVNMFRPMDLL